MILRWRREAIKNMKCLVIFFRFICDALLPCTMKSNIRSGMEITNINRSQSQDGSLIKNSKVHRSVDVMCTRRLPLAVESLSCSTLHWQEFRRIKHKLMRLPNGTSSCSAAPPPDPFGATSEFSIFVFLRRSLLINFRATN